MLLFLLCTYLFYYRFIHNSNLSHINIAAMPMPLGSNIYANMIYYDSRGNQTDKSRDKKIYQNKIDEKSILPVN